MTGIEYPYTQAPSRASPARGCGAWARCICRSPSCDARVVYYERVIGLRTDLLDASTAVLGAHDDPTPLVDPPPRAGRRSRAGAWTARTVSLRDPACPIAPRSAASSRISPRSARTPACRIILVSEAVYLTDPDGLGIEVYADRPRDSWRIDNRALEMATATLDAADLVRASRGEQWSGMPPGTRIGHVHLFVSDLASAERFYHEGLGLDKVVLEFPGALFMSAGGYHHHLGTNTWAAGAPARAAGRCAPARVERAAPDAADVEDTARALESAGRRSRATDGDVIAADPWGTSVRVTRR